MKRTIYLLAAALIALTACQSKRRYYPANLTPLPVHIQRFDSALLNISDTNITQDINAIYEQYPVFMPVFVEQVLGVYAWDTAYLTKQLPLFLHDTVYGFAATNAYEQEVFKDITPIEHSLGQAFARMKYLFPEWDVPDICFFVSGFNASLLFVEDGIAVGADMYLGSDYPFYNRVVYDYQKRTMRPECIPVDIVSAWLFRNIAFQSQHNRLLDNMIYRGKVMYLLSVIFKELPEYEVMGYTEEQWDWCLKYERATWNRLVERRDLFNSEQRIISSYLNDGPFTSQISQDSPGRLGTWVGWRIVEQYMKNHKDVGMQELMQMDDAQVILEGSYYNP